jgi:hypothetical protein
VVGILFGENNTYTYAVPIQTIETAMALAVETATNTSPVTVPNAGGAHAMAMLPEKAAPMPEFDWQRLHEAELELKATPEGGEIRPRAEESPNGNLGHPTGTNPISHVPESGPGAPMISG